MIVDERDMSDYEAYMMEDNVDFDELEHILVECPVCRSGHLDIGYGKVSCGCGLAVNTGGDKVSGYEVQEQINQITGAHQRSMLFFCFVN